MEYGPAKRRAARELGRHARDAELPDNERYRGRSARLPRRCSAPTRSRASWQRCANWPLVWMERLAAFRPHLTGAVWRGTATRLQRHPARAVLRRLQGGGAGADRSARRLRGVEHDRAARQAHRRAQHRQRLPRARRVGDDPSVGARLRRPARRPQGRSARPAPARRSGRGAGPRGCGVTGAAPATRNGPRRRTLVVGGLGVAAGVAGIGVSLWRTAGTGSAAARSLGVPLSTSRRRRADLRGAARQAAAAQLLGHLVPALRDRDAVAGSLPRPPSRGRLAGRRSRRGSTGPGASLRRRARDRLSDGLAGATGLELSRSLGNVAGGLPYSVAFASNGELRARKLGALDEATLSAWAGIGS